MTDLSKFIDDDSAYDLIHDDLDDEKVAEVYNYVPKTHCLEVVRKFVAVVQPNKSSISFESNAEGKDEAVVEGLAVGAVVPTAVVKIEYGGKYIGQDEVDKQDYAKLIHGLFDSLEDDEEGFTSSE